VHRIRLQGNLGAVRLIAGCDVAYDRRDALLWGGVVLWDRQTDIALESVVIRRPVTFPYIPGLLGFREAPVLLEALRRLAGGPPEAVLVDGHGIAHPRGFGLAAHLGLHIESPTIGCAKTRLVGEHGTLGGRRGDFTWLFLHGKRVGAVVRTRSGVRPVFISPGNRVSVDQAVDLIRGCLGPYRLPEPLRQAHLLVQAQKRESKPYSSR
jgi:deoxyribonuclease V